MAIVRLRVCAGSVETLEAPVGTHVHLGPGGALDISIPDVTEEILREDGRLEQGFGKRICELERELAEARLVLADFLAYYETDFFTLGAEDGRTLAEWIRRASNAARENGELEGRR